MDEVQITVESFSEIDAPEAGNPRWVHLLPLGAVTARDGRAFTVNEPSLIVARSTASSTEVPVDYEHQTLKAAANGKPAPAAGWVKKFEIRANGIWGLIEWTAEAFAMIKAKEYRFISPTVVVNKVTREVDRIANAGLTNMPALELTPLQRLPGGGDELERLADALLGLDKPAGRIELIEAIKQLQARSLEQLAAALGLDKSTGLPEMLAAIKQLRARQIDPAEFVPASQVQAMLTSRSDEMREVREERVRLTVENAISSGKVTPALKPWAMEYCARDMTGFEEFVAKVPAILTPGERTLPAITSESLRVKNDAEEAVALQLQIDPLRMR